MNPGEAGFLLLASRLGDPERKPLTAARLRALARRVGAMERPRELRELTAEDLRQLGYGREGAAEILRLLADQPRLEAYLRRGRDCGCVALTRITPGYPRRLRQCLGGDAPACLWAKGETSLLDTPMAALVGSRELSPPNREFARQVGAQAAKQGVTLVSGNARGADTEAQEACLAVGGRVVSVVADSLAGKPRRDGVLYLSEDGFDEGFSSWRALSRNRVIHCLGQAVFVAQSALGQGGTWSGSTKNLRFGWSRVLCFDDGSEACKALAGMGAETVTAEDLGDIPALCRAEKACLTGNDPPALVIFRFVCYNI